MMLLTGIQWAAIAVAVVVAVIVLAVGFFAMLVVGEYLRYQLSRYRTYQALAKVHLLRAKFAEAIKVKGMSNPLMRGFSIPLGRFNTAVETLDSRVESLEWDNDVRRGPHARAEWRHLRRDVKRVLRRGKQLDYYAEAPDARDGVWPFVENHAAIYADANYAGDRQPAPHPALAGRQTAAALNVGGAEAMRPVSVRRMRGAGALDEDVMPSAEERHQARIADAQAGSKVTVLKPAAAADCAVVGTYDRTGRVILFQRPAKVSVKA